MSIKIIEKSNTALEKKLNDLTNFKKTLKVGVFEDAKYDDGTPVAMVAFWNEFGTLKIPMRPFMRNALAKNKVKWVGFIKNQLMTGLSAETAFNRTGEIVRGDIVKSLTNLSPPPNSPYTIKRKGSSKPLIDTGLLRSSITYEVS